MLLPLSAIAFATNLAAADTPTLALIVGNKEENSLAIVDPASGKVLARMPTGEGPHEVAVSADGKLAFVANYGTGTAPGSTLSVIDLVGQKEIRKVDLSPLRRPHGLAVAGGKVYFTAEANRIVGRYDPAANKIDWMMGTGQATTHMVIAGKVPDQLFTANIGGDTISVIEKRHASPPSRWAKALRRSTFRRTARNYGPPTHATADVSIIDVATKKVIATLALGTQPLQPPEVHTRWQARADYGSG